VQPLEARESNLRVSLATLPSRRPFDRHSQERRRYRCRPYPIQVDMPLAELVIRYLNSARTIGDRDQAVNQFNCNKYETCRYLDRNAFIEAELIMKDRQFNQSNQGFSLVELVIALAVAGILLGVAAPNFSDAMRNSKQIVEVNELMGALRFARSEAIKRSTRTAVCAREDNGTCGADWSNGYITFIDNGATRGVIDADEQILRVAQAVDGGVWIMNRARLVNTAERPLERQFIRFGPRGTSHWRGSGYFGVCDPRGQENAKAINISLSGDPRRARTNDAGMLVSSFGGLAACGTGP